MSTSTTYSTRQEEGTDHLSRLLGGSGSRLEHLSLRYHGIADFGARLLATSLASHAALTHLDLERNKINTSGCEALASHMILQPAGYCYYYYLLFTLLCYFSALKYKLLLPTHAFKVHILYLIC